MGRNIWVLDGLSTQEKCSKAGPKNTKRTTRIWRGDVIDDIGWDSAVSRESGHI